VLPPGAIVINTARGELIRDEDLLAALDAGNVAAVGLDVFEHEPAIDPRYLTLKNAFLMPHLAADTIETQTAVGMLALDNIDAVRAGRPAPSLVTARSRAARPRLPCNSSGLAPPVCVKTRCECSAVLEPKPSGHDRVGSHFDCRRAQPAGTQSRVGRLQRIWRAGPGFRVAVDGGRFRRSAHAAASVWRPE
jgi:hypothetical protein